METVKLYDRDPFLREFTAKVLCCEPGKDGWRVELDRTAFYPEGGGQPADHGFLGGVEVLDVHERGGAVFHTCDKPLATGSGGSTICSSTPESISFPEFSVSGFAAAMWVST